MVTNEIARAVILTATNANGNIGAIIVALVSFIGAMIGLITPIIKLNTSITKLNSTMEFMIGENTSVKTQLKDHEETLADHETRLRLMEFEKESRHNEQ